MITFYNSGERPISRRHMGFRIQIPIYYYLQVRFSAQYFPLFVIRNWIMAAAAFAPECRYGSLWQNIISDTKSVCQQAWNPYCTGVSHNDSVKGIS